MILYKDLGAVSSKLKSLEESKTKHSGVQNVHKIC